MILSQEQGRNILREKFGIITTNFATKKVFLNANKELVIGVSKGQLENGDFFVQLLSRDLPQKPVTTIEMYKFSTDSLTTLFAEERSGDSGSFYISYHIPVKDLTVVYKDDFREPEDDPFSAMTIRDYFAVKHLVPISNKDWLNKEIVNVITKNK